MPAGCFRLIQKFYSFVDFLVIVGNIDLIFFVGRTNLWLKLIGRMIVLLYLSNVYSYAPPPQKKITMNICKKKAVQMICIVVLFL